MSNVINNFKLDKINFDICDYLTQIKQEYGIININEEFSFNGLYSYYMYKLIQRENKSKDKSEEINVRYLFFVGLNCFNIFFKYMMLIFLILKSMEKIKEHIYGKIFYIKALLYFDEELN